MAEGRLREIIESVYGNKDIHLVIPAIRGLIEEMKKKEQISSDTYDRYAVEYNEAIEDVLKELGN